MNPEQLAYLHYHHQLLPLHKQLVAEGKIPRGFTSYKRVHVERRILRALARTNPAPSYHPDSDPLLLRAKANACEEQLERQSAYIQELESALSQTRKRTV